MRPTSKDYYSILGVADNADPEAIKKAYRALAVEFHPDRNPNNPKAEEKFKDLTEAYGVLMDPKKRSEYDLYRKTFGAGHAGAGGGQGPRFDYSQQEIFENMFRQAFGRDAFNDLNMQFKNQGFRSGSGFFDAILFGGVGAMGKLGRLLSMVPGPIGKVGLGLRVLQGVGASLLALKSIKQAAHDKQHGGRSPRKDSGSTFDNVKSIFDPEAGHGLDLHFQITIPPHEAVAGARKQFSYTVNGVLEKLMVNIPPNTPAGQKLRVREKGKMNNDRRGDLILTVNVGAV
ncbi:MAG: J domain-containing protein [Candidatus Nitronauta litoralis]|uniref:J domain-containing protein n=1 Tax=Candidatus Nitronauta litoralis TaxID=2705533 RepID=A0A7T0BY21_9BACT|nr:MAG: J domain-containing protein [Candidatus Nitronauta litoralis]